MNSNEIIILEMLEEGLRNNINQSKVKQLISLLHLETFQSLVEYLSNIYMVDELTIEDKQKMANAVKLFLERN